MFSEIVLLSSSLWMCIRTALVDILNLVFLVNKGMFAPNFRPIKLTSFRRKNTALKKEDQYPS